MSCVVGQVREMEGLIHYPLPWRVGEREAEGEGKLGGEGGKERGREVGREGNHLCSMVDFVAV